MFDCFMMNDELDLLELRLNMLYPFFEKFVIVESNLTHSGKPKEMHFTNNKLRFEKFLPKIICLQHLGHSVWSSGLAWGNESRQRDLVLEVLKTEKPKDGLLFVSDIDEIPKPEKLFEAQCIAWETNRPVVFNMAFCMYYMNLVSEIPFRGAYLYNPDYAKEIQSYFKYDRYGPSTFRWQVTSKGHENDYPNIYDAGWHFSTVGGVETIKRKLDSYAHLEFNTQEIASDEHLLKCMAEGVPYFEKLFKFNDQVLRFAKKDLSFLPDYVQFNKDKYQKYILGD